MRSKEASSQVAWALLTEGVTKARIDVHRLQHLINRALQLVEGSSQKEHLYQVAGDIITVIPHRIDQLNVSLDRTSLALAKMGQEFLESRLPIADKTMVEEAVQGAFNGVMQRHAHRVARRYLQNRNQSL